MSSSTSLTKRLPFFVFELVCKYRDYRNDNPHLKMTPSFTALGQELKGEDRGEDKHLSRNVKARRISKSVTILTPIFSANIRSEPPSRSSSNQPPIARQTIFPQHMSDLKRSQRYSQQARLQHKQPSRNGSQAEHRVQSHGITPEPLKKQNKESKSLPTNQPHQTRSLGGVCVSNATSAVQGQAQRRPPPTPLVELERSSSQHTATNPTKGLGNSAHKKRRVMAHASEKSRQKEVRQIKEAQGGAIYSVVNKTTGDRYIVKRIDLQLNPHLQPIIKNECAIHGYLSTQQDASPYIAKMYKARPNKGKFEMYIEMGENGELYTHIVNANAGNDCETKAGANHREKIAKKYFRQLVEGCAWMHSKAVCHRDLSLDNVVLDRDYNLKVIDFGTAYKYSEGQPVKSLSSKVGKTSHMSPELYRQDEYDGYKADVWSCGIILFELLFAFPPIEHPCEEMDQRFEYIISGKFRLLLKEFGIQHVSEAAIDLMEKMLVVEEKRPTMADILTHSWLNE